MKQLLYIISFFMFSYLVQGQTSPIQTIGVSGGRVEAKGQFKIDSLGFMGKFNGFPVLTSNSDTLGAWFLNTADAKVYVRDTVSGTGGHQWSALFIGSLDVSVLPETKQDAYAQGLTASNNVTNYGPTTLDSLPHVFMTTRPAGYTGNDFGGWLTPNLTGDSVLTTAPFGVIIGHSIALGHPALNGRLQPNGTNGFVYNYPDSPGQLSYALRSLTHMRWYNAGIGGETSNSTLLRFYRDALGYNSFVEDGRPNQTMLKRPNIVIIITGINDISLPLQVENNLEQMAAICMWTGVRCVILNQPGDAVLDATQNAGILTVNQWLANGALDKYGACVVDFNSWWNDPNYNYDNIHHTNLIVDDIHPSKPGYDSLALYIFQKANLPVLTRAKFVNVLDSAGFTGYSQPSAVAINTVPYSVPTSSNIDSFPITSYIGGNQESSGDSVWIKVTASVPVTGTSFTGISGILWHLDNNPYNLTYYTKKTWPQSTNANSMMNSLSITSRDFSNENVFTINEPGFAQIMQVQTSNGNPNYLFSTNTPLLGANFSVGVPASFTSNVNSFPITTNVTNFGSLFGKIDVGGTTTITANGYGIDIVNNGMNFQSGGNGISNYFVFSGGGATPPSGNAIGQSLGNIVAQRGIGDLVGNTSSFWEHLANPVINNTTTVGIFDDTVGAFSYTPTITSLGSTYNVGFYNTFGNNLLNTTPEMGGVTAIGTGTPVGSAQLDIHSNTRGFMPPRMTQGQRDSIGYISSISGPSGTYSVFPSATITGGTGQGARLGSYNASGTGDAATVFIIEPGYGYMPSVPVTVTLTGGVGSAGTFTATIHGPDSGLIIFNTTIDSLQYFDGAKWQNMGSAVFPQLLAKADLTGQTTAGTVTSYAVPGSGGFNTFSVGGYLTITAISLDVIQLQVTYTDETNTSRTQSFFVQGSTTGLSTTGANGYSPIAIRVKQGTTITMATILTTGTGSITYDAGASITQLY